ncbi:unnamed protein product [Alternaria alternata]
MHRHAAYPYANPAPTTTEHSGTSSAFSASANPDEAWTKISDLAERRRIQNRIAQRNYRKKLKKRLKDLERRNASRSASPEQKPTPLELAMRTKFSDDTMFATNPRAPEELTLLHEPLEPLVDLIFVHGLGGDPVKTWTKGEDSEQFWPQAWLPQEPVLQNVRISTFGYKNDGDEHKDTASMIHDAGEGLLREISTNVSQRTQEDLPIIMIGHSIGGLVIKKTYTLAWRGAATQALAARVKCLIFLATPQRDAGLASTVRKILRASGRFNYNSSLSDFEKTSVELNKINDEFRHYAGEVRILSFYETIETNLGIQSELIVDKDSASMGVKHERVHPLNADHRMVCKFDSIYDTNYIAVKNAIESIAEDILGDAIKRDAQISALKTYLDMMDTPIDELNKEQDNQITGSCSWIEKRKGFQAWTGTLTRPPYVPLYWISAPPATGKTVLAGHVIKQLQRRGHDCSYYFFKHSQKGKNTMSAMLRSMALQMAIMHPIVRKELLDLQKNGIAFDKEHENSVWRVLFVGAIFRTSLERPEYWVIDALDECIDSMKLFSLLSQIECRYGVQILITSRGPWPDFERQFARLGHRGMTDTIPVEDTTHDIRLFFEQNMDHLPVEEEADKRLMVEKLVTESAGCFLWARLVLQGLESVYSEEHIEEVIEGLPMEMGLLYERILGEMSKSVRRTRLAKSLLVWAICAVRPLHISELVKFIEIDIGAKVPDLKGEIRFLCGQLLHVDNTGHVQLVHRTLRTALTDGSSKSEFAISKIEGHGRLAFVCLEYLCEEKMRSPRNWAFVEIPRSAKNPIADYACASFSEHLVRSSSSDTALFLELEKFLRSNVLTWIEYIAKTKKNLHHLTKTARNLQYYLSRRAYHIPPFSAADHYVSQWATDLMRITAKFGRYLLDNPDSIYGLIPPLCPRDSAINQQFGVVRSGLSVSGVGNGAWEDSVSHIDFQQDCAMSIAAGPYQFAIGTSSGRIILYLQDTCQESMSLDHGESAKVLHFGNSYKLASAGAHMIRLWDLKSESLVWTYNIKENPILLQFDQDDRLIVATESNRVIILSCDDGTTLCDHSFPNSKAPLSVTISPDCSMVAFTHPGEGASAWYLPDHLDDENFLEGWNEEVTSSFMTSESFPNSIIFNKNPALDLMVVTFQDGLMVLYETAWAPEVVKTNQQDCQYIACSPDGRILATRSNSGVIGLWDFGTLTLLWQIKTREPLGRALAFTDCGTRIIDLQNHRVKVWEFATLIRKGTYDENSSATLPVLGVAFGDEEDVVPITATCIHPTRDVILAGKEDGSVNVYSGVSGGLEDVIYTHKLDGCVRRITVSAGDIVASQDASNKVMAYRLKQESPNHFSATQKLMDLHMEEPAEQLLINGTGDRLLISTATTDQLWIRSETSTFKRAKVLEAPSRFAWRWMSSIRVSGTLLLFVDQTIRRFNWDTLDELDVTDPPRKIKISTTSLTGSDVVLKALETDVTGTNIIAEFSHQLDSKATERLIVWQADNSASQEESASIEPSLVLSSIEIKHLLGIFEHSIVYLNHNLWVCSIDLQESTMKRQVKKHFFVPLEFLGHNDGFMASVSKKGDVLFPTGKEIAVVRNGLKQFLDSYNLASEVHGWDAHMLALQTNPKMIGRPFDDNFIAPQKVAARGESANDYIIRILTEDRDTRTVFAELLERMDREQLVEAVRKGLRDLHLSLVNNAKSQPEELIARLLESRSDREKICEGIAEIIVSERFQYGMAMREANEKNHLSDTLRQSEPFQTLLNDLRMQILPQSLKDIGLQSAGVAVSLNNSPKPAQTTNQLASSGAQAAGVQQAVLDDPRILFGVRGPHPALKLEQISVDNTMNDSNFYDELKKYYRLNRGRLRYWFSFWRLGYCEVVKVSNTPQ